MDEQLQIRALKEELDTANKAIEDYKQKLKLLREKAARNQRKLELDINFFKCALLDSKAKISNLTILNKSLHVLAKEACNNEELLDLKTKELDADKEVRKLMEMQRQSNEENYYLKKLLIQTCDRCRARLPIRNNPTQEKKQQAEQPAACHQQSTAAPTSSSPRRGKKIAAGAPPRRGILRSHSQQSVLSSNSWSSPPTPTRGILKTNSQRSLLSTGSSSTIPEDASFNASFHSSSSSSSDFKIISGIGTDKSGKVYPKEGMFGDVPPGTKAFRAPSKERDPSGVQDEPVSDILVEPNMKKVMEKPTAVNHKKKGVGVTTGTGRMNKQRKPATATTGSSHLPKRACSSHSSGSGWGKLMFMGRQQHSCEF